MGDPAALQAVYEPNSEVQAAAVRALGSSTFRTHREECEPLFPQVLTTHASPVAWSHARWALQALSGAEVQPASPSEPPSVLPGRGPDWQMCQGRVTVLEEPHANPLLAVRVHGTLAVVEGLAHLFSGDGRLVRVDASEGR